MAPNAHMLENDKEKEQLLDKIPIEILLILPNILLFLFFVLLKLSLQALKY